MTFTDWRLFDHQSQALLYQGSFTYRQGALQCHIILSDAFDSLVGDYRLAIFQLRRDIDRFPVNRGLEESSAGVTMEGLYNRPLLLRRYP